MHSFHPFLFKGLMALTSLTWHIRSRFQIHSFHSCHFNLSNYKVMESCSKQHPFACTTRNKPLWNQNRTDFFGWLGVRNAHKPRQKRKQLIMGTYSWKKKKKKKKTQQHKNNLCLTLGVQQYQLSSEPQCSFLFLAEHKCIYLSIPCQSVNIWADFFFLFASSAQPRVALS